jgi:inward rectifier potassium channel
MFPTTFAANVLMVAESITGLALAAMWTGLVFAKFSRSTARLVFSDRVVISPVGGMPTLMFRIGNQRRNQIIDARIRVVMIRTERTDDGGTFYRMLDLKLTRERALSLSRSWSVVHVIDESSPLHRENPDSLAAQEVEVQVLVLGIDDILMQTVHAQHRYFAKQIVFGARHADVLTELPDGDLLLDLRRFNDIEPTRPTDAFPYPNPSDPAARRE